LSTTSHGSPRRRPRGPRPAPPARRPHGPPTPTPTPNVIVGLPASTTFADLGVPAPIVAALDTAGCRTPLPIQAATLPSSLAGRDVLGRARTGSGKTVAFAVPAVMALSGSDRRRRPGAPRALVLVPTRELAAQVAATIGPLARAMGLRVASVHGGVSQGPQVSALRRGVDVVVACPGRLEDLIQQRHCSLAQVQMSVLDEADHLADLGFVPAVRRLLDQTPAGGQRLLFSATLDRDVDALVARYLTDPVTHSVDPVDSPPAELAHYTFSVAPADKGAVVRELASGEGRSLLFTRTKHAAKKLASELTRRGIPALDLHGNLSQAQRSRNLAAFAGGSVRVLVATDIAARGIHVSDIGLVVHVDPPTEHKAYLHRSGRTARAGASGSVVTVILPDQARDVTAMIRKAGIRPTAARVGPGAAQISALTGPPADLVAAVTRPGPTTSAPAPRRGGPHRAQRGSRRERPPRRG
jgi:superfamily II DNA/RNA helicase